MRRLFWSPEMETAAGLLLEAQYQAHPEWEEAKDVIENLDIGAIVRAVLDAAMVERDRDER